ncbi:hypothetical protein AVL62_08760 [Serinicoccus chungangensis]|uniref:DUF4352 domain-containing protein n=1 Tax=Serinicoccus chungangensis TaxID=767452 RepID=A0A0W8I131_9MICO|nr:hypothetical protein AVL62_08760 [Serinicoccus chungangensis]
MLAGCGGSEGEPESAPATQAPTISEAPTSEAATSEAESTEEETSEEPTSEAPETTEPEAIEVHQIGEPAESPTADLVVNAIEDRDGIPMPNGLPDMPAVLEPEEGERLWYVDITWTNNLSESVAKECHGPYAMDLHAFDVEGREMLMVEQPGFIEGQNCQTGLMQGQTGTWLTAFHGLDAEFGWLAFDDYNGDPVFVVKNPDLELYQE